MSAKIYNLRKLAEKGFKEWATKEAEKRDEQIVKILAGEVTDGKDKKR